MLKFVEKLIPHRFRSLVSKEPYFKPSEEKLSPEDLVVLLVGPIGSKMEEFVGEITGVTRNNSQQTLVVPSETRIQTQTVDIAAANGHRRVTFLAPPLFDGHNINEKSVLEEAKSYLEHNRSQKPNVDRILYFDDPEEKNTYRIPLKPVGVYWSSLESVYGTENVETITSRIALVISTDRGGSSVKSKVPEEWGYLSKTGAKVFAFNKGSAANLAAQII